MKPEEEMILDEDEYVDPNDGDPNEVHPKPIEGKMYESVDHIARFVMKNGDIIQGFVSYYTPWFEDYSTLGHSIVRVVKTDLSDFYTLYEDDIESIEILEKAADPVEEYMKKNTEK